MRAGKFGKLAANDAQLRPIAMDPAEFDLQAEARDKELITEIEEFAGKFGNLAASSVCCGRPTVVDPAEFDFAVGGPRQGAHGLERGARREGWELGCP